MFQLGDQAELLVVVREETDGCEFSPTDDEPEEHDTSDTSAGPRPLEIVLTTDAPNNLVLHWGAMAPSKGRQWNRPPQTMLPATSTKMDGSPSVETEFAGFSTSSDFAPEEIREAKVPL